MKRLRNTYNMTKTIQLAGEEWPVRMTLGAMNKFDNKFKAEGITSLNMHGAPNQRIDHMAHLMLYMIQAGLKSEGDDRKIDIEWIHNNVEMDDLKQFTETFEGETNEEKKT